MKNLDESKAYSLKDLNDDQLKELALWFIQNKHEEQHLETINEMIDWFNEFKNEMLFHYFNDCGDLIWGFRTGKLNKQVINALELFEDDFKTESKYEFQHIEYNASNNTIDLVFYKKKDNGLIKVKRVTYMYVSDKNVQDEYDKYMNEVKESVKEFLNK